MSLHPNEHRGQLYSRHIEILSQRYAEALRHCNADRALVFAGIPRLRDRDDQPAPFVADPYFMQWVPCANAAGSIVEFRAGEKPRLVFVADEDFWHAPTRPPSDDIEAAFDVVVTKQNKAAQALNPDAATVVIGSASVDPGPTLDSQAFINFLDYERAVKTEYEIDCMVAANAIAIAGHRAVAEYFANGISEFELHMRYCLASLQREDELPYANIVGLNEHASYLHYQHQDRQPPPSVRSLLIDAGAQVNGYAADVTRTYATAQGRFADLIAATDELQQSICALVSAGQQFAALNERCHELLAELLVECDLVNCSAEAAVETGATTAFLPHGLGHLLGLQVHDVGGHSTDHSGTIRPPPQRHPFLRLTRPLLADMVVTIEPGIYFIRSLLEDLDRRSPGILRHTAIEALLPFGGIRIEDNVRVKSRGHENLTRNAFRN